MQYPLVQVGVQGRETVYEPVPDPSPQGNQLAEIFSLLLRRWLAIVVTGAVIFLASFSISMSAPRVYSAVTRILVSPATDPAIGVGRALESASSDFSPVEREIEILGSSPLMLRLVDKLNLASDSEFNADLRPQQGLPEWLPLPQSPKRNAAAKSPEAVRNAVASGVGSAVKLRRRGANGIDIIVESRSPERAALMANTLVDLYVEYQLEMRMRSLERTSGWLTQRLGNLRAELRDKELAAENHRMAHGLSVAAGGGESSAPAADVQALLVSASADLAEREARLRQVETMLAEGRSADTIGGVLNSTVVSDLRSREAELKSREAELSQKYSDKHPSLQSVRSEIAIVDLRIKEEVQRVSTNLRNEVDVARARFAELRASFGDMAGTRGADNAAIVKYRELLRDATGARSVYETFLERSHEIEQQGSLPTASTQLIAAAEPPGGPSRPTRNSALLIAACLAAFGGLAAGLLVHIMDRTVASVEELERKLGEAAIASVPSLRKSDYKGLRRQKRTPADYVVEKPLSAFAEAIRVLRTSIVRPGIGQRIGVIAVTSAVPNEGKTTISLCLARAAALAGQKVAVIDCDLRRSSLLSAIAPRADAGLIDVLAAGSAWKDVMVSDPATNFDILLCGRSLEATDDLFSSKGMERLIDELRGAYDLVILDCAPVLALAETRIVMTHADAAVLVMRSQKTSVNVTRTALRVMRNAGAQPLGVVLNCVNPKLLGRSTDADPLNYASSKQYYIS